MRGRSIPDRPAVTPVIQGNHIGVSLDGKTPLANGTSGIVIGSSNAAD